MLMVFLWGNYYMQMQVELGQSNVQINTLMPGTINKDQIKLCRATLSFVWCLLSETLLSP
jgi:hypothetical protein